MAITAGDIKLVASSVMSDVPEGGGAPSGTIINDATTNTIFPDISEIDRAGGRVNLRKVFAKVRTPDTEGYFGANIIVAEPFEDPLVSATLFVGETFDRRSDAASRMEAYLAMGATYSGLLFGNHLAGQSVVTLLQRVEQSLPVIGQTLVLTKNIGLVNEFSQFVRLTGATATVRNFTDDRGDFSRMQIVCSISDQLQEDFNGFDASRYDTTVNYIGKTRINESVVADAARYYGIVPLEDAVGIGDFTVQTEGIFTQLVPSTRVEVPIADSRLNQQAGPLVPAGASTTRSLNAVFTTAQQLFVGLPVLPGSLSISRAGITLTDRAGALVDVSDTTVGLVDYDNGILTLSSNVFGVSSGVHEVTFVPSATPTLVNDTFEVPVTTESQRFSYVFTLDPIPTPRTLRVSYRAQGTWYTLSDDGSGALRGSDSSIGAGTLNQSTGTVSVTVGALPDVGSSVISAYYAAGVARPPQSIGAAGVALPRAFGVPVDLGVAIKPGTLTLTWNDGVARTATDSGGVLTGDATGKVEYADGRIEFRPNLLPASGVTVTVATTESTPANEVVAAFTDGGANWTATLATPIVAGSVVISVSGSFVPSSVGLAVGTVWGQAITRTIRLFDDGSGGLLYANGNGGNSSAGTINYGTGAISITKSLAGFHSSLAYHVSTGAGYQGVSYFTRNTPFTVANGSTAQEDAAIATYSGGDVGAAPSSFTITEIFLPANVNGTFATTGSAPKITGFTLGTSLHTAGMLDTDVRRDPSPSTGVGTVVGSRSVVGGMSGITLTSWTAGTSSAVTNVLGAEQPGISGTGTAASVTQAVFRTAVSPLLNGGFQIAGNLTSSGAGFTATANSDGLILTATAVVGETPGAFGVIGLVDYEMGVCRVWFGRRVPASMASDIGVVDLSDLAIAGVEYVQLSSVQADTLRYNATGYSYLPLNPELLGLNPVRLPPDGRVPIFRPGSFAVLGHTGTVGPAAVTNGQTLSAGRTRLSRVRIIGNDGNVIDTGYTADLDAGTVTFTDVTGYSQPITFEHRIEDTMLVSQAQITGAITFTRPSTHVYPVPGSYLSSALVAGDVQARAQPAFDQVSWTGVWSDGPIGSPTTGTFNDTLHPIEVTNLGALTERWAVRFTNTTAFEVFGEHVGVIATGSTGADCEPMNPQAGVPYFSIPAAGWGLGWSTGNIMRFNTVGAEVPVWIARTILQGPETVEEDTFTVLVRGDVDRP